ncbi:mitochondrial import inner membrane translocase subunit Tim13-B-like [Leptopilina heterotoma]|uniref:mitochondrial import inner membrane translocase subunit Tim13-B-like n=1 Tax=Leptopilina heterotoma TaxID=63436 RepID=UPI001CA8A9F3|nr:mitochondrial import inner membrane translocase subunit Tim13-B-like [Leptopilina heterotoma]
MESLRPGSLTTAQKDALIEQVKQEIAVASVHEFITIVTKKCFQKCIAKPGTSLDSSEQKCLAMCMDRYMDTLSLVGSTYSRRLQRERERM